MEDCVWNSLKILEDQYLFWVKIIFKGFFLSLLEYIKKTTKWWSHLFSKIKCAIICLGNAVSLVAPCWAYVFSVFFGATVPVVYEQNSFLNTVLVRKLSLSFKTFMIPLKPWQTEKKSLKMPYSVLNAVITGRVDIVRRVWDITFDYGWDIDIVIFIVIMYDPSHWTIFLWLLLSCSLHRGVYQGWWGVVSLPWANNNHRQWDSWLVSLWAYFEDDH